MAKTSFLTPPAVADELGVHVDRVRGWIKTGELRAHDLGDGLKRPRFRVAREDLTAFLQRRTVHTRPETTGPRRRRPAGVVTEFF